MRYLVSGEEMKLLDENTSNHFHVPSIVLMEEAAMCFVQELFGIFMPQKVLVVVGKGNNGGDGLAIARLLNQKGVKASVYFVDGGQGSESYELQKQIYLEYKYQVIEELDERDDYDVIVDAIFGIGLSREVIGKYSDVITRLNAMKGLKISVDMPSGICSDSGLVLGNAFKADYTITFSFGKIGQYLWPGTDYCGRVIVTQMGITEDSLLGVKPRIFNLMREDLQKLPERLDHSNKGTYGKVLVIGGCLNMAGAVCFSASAAYRTGAGLVKVISHELNREIIQKNVPEAILATYDENDLEASLKAIEEGLGWANAVVVGPGLGVSDFSKELLAFVLKMVKVPVLIDADGLNIIAYCPELLDSCKADIVLTPHLGEMSRLTGRAVKEIQQDILMTGLNYAREHRLVCVLKDFHTVTALPNGDGYINTSGNNGMATAGSGDVLSGVIGALLAGGMNAAEASAYGVYVHGLAGDEALKNSNHRSVMASDIVEGLKVVL